MNRQYTALGGLAIIVVVLNHSILFGIEYGEANGVYLRHAELIYGIISAIGFFAVPSFLFISGAFIAYAAKSKKTISKKFVINNLKRLLQPYLFWAIIFYIMVYFTRDWQYSILGYIKNLIVGFPYQFVPLIVLFYALSPILIKIGRKYPKSLIILIAGYQLFLLIILEPSLIGRPSLLVQLNVFVPPVFGTTMAEWGVFFPLGMVLSMHNQAIKPFLQKYRSVFIGITLLLFAFMLLYLTDIISSNWPRYLAPVVFVFVLSAINRNSILGVRYLERVGKHSYSVYLMHLIILELLLIAIETFFPNLLAYPLLLFPILFIVGVGGPVFFKESIKKLSLPKVCQNMF